MEITGTFKLRKVELMKDGFDPARVADPLYWRNAESGRYEPLDARRYEEIASGAIKF
jgi:fatty-acyl-CoA synthase